LNLRSGYLENIFYQEVIIKWFQNSYYSKITDSEEGYKANLLQAQDIIEMYLKEQSQSVDNTIEFDKWLEDKKFRYSFNKEMCYQDILSSTTSIIDQFLKSPYQAQKGVLESAVKCNEIFLEFVYNTIDVEEMNYQNSNLVTEKKEAIDFADYLLGNFEMDSFPLLHPKRNGDEDLCWKLSGTEQRYTTIEMYQIWLNEPKAIEDNVWDEFAKEYSQLHSLDLEQVRYWFIPLLEFGKQHYSLIKK
jgi:hypothetical protein